MKRVLLLISLLLLVPSAAQAADFVAVDRSGNVQLLSAAQARKAPSGRYLAIERNRPVTLDTWGLDRINQRTLPLDSNISSFGGQGVTVYVIDSGIDASHPLLGGRVREGMSTWGTSPWDDCPGHGTAVAGVIAGEKYGVAPGAELVPVQAFTCMGFGSLETVLPALGWIRDHHPHGKPAVLNASFGLPSSPTLQLLFRQILDDGIAVAASAGNSKEDACVRTPANVSQLITTAATNHSDSRASFSNWGKCVDLFAPGESVSSLAPGGFGTYSGASWAAPHVAGAMTRVLSQNPTLSPRSLSDTIVQNATTGVVRDAFSPNKLLFLGSGMNIINHAPPHDAFARPRALTQGTAQSGSNRDASREAGEPRHGNSSLWYKISIPSAQPIQLSLSSATFSSRLSLYRGNSLESLRLIKNHSFRRASKRTARITTRSLAKGIYYVAVSGRQDTGSFRLIWNK